MAIKRAPRTAAATETAVETLPPPNLIPNAPPAGSSAELLARYEDLRAAAERWRQLPSIDDQKTADQFEAFRKQCRALAKEIEDARKSEKAPHQEAAAAVDVKWRPFTDGVARWLDVLTPKLTAFMQRERERIAAEREKAEQEAAAARRAAEREAERAMASGSLEAADDAAAAARRADDAARAADKAAAAKVAAGGNAVVNGVKRSATLRTFETITIEDPIAALTQIVTVVQPTDALRDAIASMVRTYRKAQPSAAISGVVIKVEERAV